MRPKLEQDPEAMAGIPFSCCNFLGSSRRTKKSMRETKAWDSMVDFGTQETSSADASSPFKEQERVPETIHACLHCLEELAAGFQLMLSCVMSVAF
jgi:hypothetical protein